MSRSPLKSAVLVAGKGGQFPDGAGEERLDIEVGPDVSIAVEVGRATGGGSVATQASVARPMLCWPLPTMVTPSAAMSLASIRVQAGQVDTHNWGGNVLRSTIPSGFFQRKARLLLCELVATPTTTVPLALTARAADEVPSRRVPRFAMPDVVHRKARVPPKDSLDPTMTDPSLLMP